MPLPADENLVKTSETIVQTFKDIFGSYPATRPAHAKGVLLNGTFTPTPLAGTLSSAQHFNQASTPILARFSSSTGIPVIPDTDPNASPRGLAVRFQLASTPRRLHTDIISHSADGFPGSNATEALGFFNAVKAGTVPAFLATHPKALAFIQLPKPAPESFATEQYFAVNAFRLISRDGKATTVRYRFVPEAGISHLDEETLKTKGQNFLFEELAERVSGGEIAFKLVAQVAEEGDVTKDNTVKWPADREVVGLGMVTLTDIVMDSEEVQKTIIFDPIPRTEGVEPSDDELLEVRASVYLLSGRERREETEAQKVSAAAAAAAGIVPGH